MQGHLRIEHIYLPNQYRYEFVVLKFIKRTKIILDSLRDYFILLLFYIL